MNLQQTKNTPAVFLSVRDCIFEIKGPSFAEHISEVYKPVLSWIDEEIPNLDCELNCHFNINVLNSVSYKNIIEIIMRLDHFAQQEKKINIKWHYYKDDEDNYEVGKDLSELFDIPFDLIVEND